MIVVFLNTVVGLWGSHRRDLSRAFQPGCPNLCYKTLHVLVLVALGGFYVSKYNNWSLIPKGMKRKQI